MPMKRSSVGISGAIGALLLPWATCFVPDELSLEGVEAA